MLHTLFFKVLNNFPHAYILLAFCHCSFSPISFNCLPKTPAEIFPGCPLVIGISHISSEPIPPSEMGALVYFWLLEMAARESERIWTGHFRKCISTFLTQKHYILIADMKQVTRTLFQQIEPTTFHHKVRAPYHWPIQLFRETLSLQKCAHPRPTKLFPSMWENPNGQPQSILGSESHKLFLDRTVLESQRGGIWTHENSFHKAHLELFYQWNHTLWTSIKQYLSFLSALSAVPYVLTLCRTTFLETTAYRRLWRGS